MRFLALFILTVTAIWAQVLPPAAERYGLLREFLELSDGQLEKIQQQNDTFARFTRVRTQRIVAVQNELEVEKTRSPLDPVSLGIRTAEIESIRRDIAERNAKLIADNLGVLTEGQRTKVKVLEDVVRMLSTANQAQALKLAPDDCANLSRIAATSGIGLSLGLCSPLTAALGGLLP